MRLKPLASLLAILLMFAPGAWGAPRYKVLHAFTGGSDGGSLWGNLLADSRGNVYGTTSYGGPHGGGTVFELAPNPDGTWSQTDLYSFCNQSGCTDGGGSTGGLIFDTAGNLYGTTRLGGAYEYGTVFELTRQSDQTWDEAVLHSFDTQDGVTTPYAGVVMDAAGNLFGTGAGWAYELSPSSGGWTLAGLHEFTGENGDGSAPIAGVILDYASDLYGTTERGGAHKAGTVYELMPTSGGWSEQILHSFPAFTGDGQVPGVGALTRGPSGRLYGTTAQGGANICGDVGCGTIFRLARGAGGRWKETILYSFSPKGNGAGGSGPGAGVVLDKAGNIYGTTVYGGSQCGCGVVYKLAPQAKGKWKYAVLHRFTGSDGAQPDANLILDKKGNLYGTTATGGAGGYGVAFEITP